MPRSPFRDISDAEMTARLRAVAAKTVALERAHEEALIERIADRVVEKLIERQAGS